MSKAATRGLLKNLVKFTGKHLRQSLFLIKLQAWPANLLKRDSNKGVSCEFCEIFKNTSFAEPLWATASDMQRKKII